MVNEAKILKKYLDNEGMNYHTENAVMLIKLFGTKAELVKAKQIQRKHMARGHILYDEQQWLSKHGHKHYYKLLTK